MGQRISEFDTWQAGYSNAIVQIFIAGTTALAPVFTDVACTVAAANPQTLINLALNGFNYGKFAQSIYTTSNYYLFINSTDQTGVMYVPITSLTGQDISAAVAIATGALQSRSMADYMGEVFNARNFGVLGAVGTVGASAVTNTTTIQAAINACAAVGGGRVIIPEGAYAFNQLNVPTGVLLAGKSRLATVIQSTVAGNVITLQGARAGLADITLDGVNLQANSVGVYSVAISETRFLDCLIKRFNVGMLFRGGRRANWENLYIDNCAIGAQLQGDKDANNTGTGDQFRNNRWCGGRVSTCTTTGVQLNFVDLACWHNAIENVGFENNTGVGLQLNGSRHFIGKEIWWSGNAGNLLVQDGVNLTYVPINVGINVLFQGGSMGSGTVALQNTLQEICFDRVEFAGAAITLTQPLNPILIKDCIEDSAVTITGDGTKWCRLKSCYGQLPASFGTTTDATVTKAWGVNLTPGQRCNLRAIVIGNGRNTIDYYVQHIAIAAHLPGYTLAYQAQTAAFTTGDILTGATSGAKARMTANANAGATGTFTLRSITGTFANGEIITGATGGSASVNGLIVVTVAALLGAPIILQTVQTSDGTFAATFAVNQQEVQVTVKGAAAKSVEWTIAVECELSP